MQLSPGRRRDLQRVGPGKKINTDFIDFSTVAIGLYGAAAGIPLNVLLTMQDVYAASHSKFGTAERDGTYTHLREDNVWNTRPGYDLFASGRIKRSPTGAPILKREPPR